MPGLTPYQATARLCEWKYGIELKMKTLKRGARFYMVLNYFIGTLIAMTTVVLLAVQSFFLGRTLVGNASIIFHAVVLGLQLLLALLNVTNSIVNPSKKSEKCSDCAKSYDALYRDVSIQADRLSSYPDEESEELHQILLCYVLRENAILTQEPGLVFYGHNSGAVVQPYKKTDMSKFRNEIEGSNLNWETKQRIFGYVDGHEFADVDLVSTV